MGALSYARAPQTVLASAARTATGQSTAVDVGYLDNISVFIDATAVSGTAPSMTVNVEWSFDGTNWFTSDPVDTMTAITAAGKKVKRFDVKGTLFRLNYAITGTTPSFTFAATVVKGS